MKSARATATLTDCAVPGLSGLLLFPLCTFHSMHNWVRVASTSAPQKAAQRPLSVSILWPRRDTLACNYWALSVAHRPFTLTQTLGQPQPNKIWEILYSILLNSLPVYHHLSKVRSIYRSLYRSLILSIICSIYHLFYLSFYHSIYRSIVLSIYRSICLSIVLSVRLSISLSFYCCISP